MFSGIKNRNSTLKKQQRISVIAKQINGACPDWKYEQVVRPEVSCPSCDNHPSEKAVSKMARIKQPVRQLLRQLFSKKQVFSHPEANSQPASKTLGNHHSWTVCLSSAKILQLQHKALIVIYNLLHLFLLSVLFWKTGLVSLLLVAVARWRQGYDRGTTPSNNGKATPVAPHHERSAWDQACWLAQASTTNATLPPRLSD